MTLKRMDNVLIVVDDLEAVKAFFIELSPGSNNCRSSWRNYFGQLLRGTSFGQHERFRKCN